MRFGDRPLERGMKGKDVEELQLRLAGFRGTVPDGDFGPGTELQVIRFQSDFMDTRTPSGVVDTATLDAIDDLAHRFPFDFDALRCPCGTCSGFGQNRFKNRYRSGQPRLEMFHRYEYPGIHRMLLWAVRGLHFYADHHTLVVTSGYRCGVRNEQTRRSSTNHHGKAIDLDVVGIEGDRREDMRCCDDIRGIVVEHASAQIGWNATNRKALEPSNIAPTWIHYDVRCYQPKFLRDRYFCTDVEGLDSKVLD